ncbi:MAG: uncharacterized protein KVP18_001769 [Porospora cf. gigantea A]|uniref:uncharacterized protein n=1 Tax=Porospora cf. gigantea A TaxID=2853593 RepID=UPI00355A0818|nr:MAG: hypothetical protein KVP18_001769 [Porospora cf. gigantea A]
MRHNNKLPSSHRGPHWQRHVKTWFDQPMRHARRYKARQERKAQAGVRPMNKLLPVVRCQTAKFNWRQRFGKGFSLAELKAVGLTALAATTIGIRVDARRNNQSEDGFNTNVERLQTYLNRIVVFPKNGQAKKGLGGIPDDVTKEQAKDVKGKVLPGCDLRKVFPVPTINTDVVDYDEALHGKAFKRGLGKTYSRETLQAREAKEKKRKGRK